MHVEGMVHGVVRGHLVDQSDLTWSPTVNDQAIAPFLAPFLRSMICQIMLLWLGCSVDLRHEVFPLEAIAASVVRGMLVL